MNNQEYWEKRIDNKTWETYNSLEEKNRAVFSMYNEAADEIAKEIYKVGEKLKTGTPTLSDMHKYNRLNHLKANIDGIVQELTESTEKQATSAMQDGYKLTYKACSEGIGVDFALPDKKLMEETLKRPWLGSNFSKRLWGNAKELEKELNSTLLKGLQQGKTVTEMAIVLDAVMHKGFNAAHKLVRTESMHYMNQAALQSYIDADVTHVRVWAAPDERVCNTCRAYHDKLYPINKVPVLPLHANCRCTVIPEIDIDVDDELEFVRKNTFEGLNILQRQYIISELKSIPPSHRTLARPAVNDIIFTKEGYSHYDRKNKSVYILENPEKGELIHEMAHALETELDLWHDKEFVEMVKRITESSMAWDIIYDETFPKNIHRLESSLFVSEYQGRIYDYDNVIKNGQIDYRHLGEYFTEGYKEYIQNPDNLKNKDAALYDYIKRRFR